MIILILFPGEKTLTLATSALGQNFVLEAVVVDW